MAANVTRRITDRPAELDRSAQMLGLVLNLIALVVVTLIAWFVLAWR